MKEFFFSVHSVRRTRVIDDECDYFTTNSKWLSRQDRDTLQKREDELHSQRHKSKSRQDRVVSVKMYKVVLSFDKNPYFFDDPCRKGITNTIKTFEELLYFIVTENVANFFSFLFFVLVFPINPGHKKSILSCEENYDA